MSERQSRPWRMFLPLGLVLLLAAGWSAYWFIAMGEIQKGLAREEANLATAGIALDCAARHFGGFPFRFSFTCDHPALAIDRPDQKISTRSGNLKVYVQAWNFRHAIALLEGPTSISGIDALHTWKFRHGLVRASLRVSSGLDAQAVIDVPDLMAENLGRAAKIVLNGRTIDGKTAEFAAALSGLEFDNPKGTPIRLENADALLSAPLSLLTAADPLRHSAARAETVTLSNFSVRNGTLALASAGTLGVDANGFPAGVIVAKASNLDELLNEAVKAGALSPKDAGNARAMALLLNGGKPENAEMKFVARDGSLYWGLVKLADLQPLF